MQTALILPELASGRGTIRQGRMVEGQTRQRLGHDPANHSISIIEDIDGRNTKRRDTRRTQPLVPPGIARRPIAPRVCLPIHLHRETSIAAEEVQNIRPRRMLPPEFETVRSLAKHLPENDFRQSHLATKLACASGRRSPRFWCDILEHTPPPCCARSPSPRLARGGIYSIASRRRFSPASAASRCAWLRMSRPGRRAGPTVQISSTQM